ncbi:MAG: ATP-binding protein [Promethearchaeota archaeon]
MLEAKYKKAAQIIFKAGGTPIPVTETFIKILRTLLKDDEEELDLILSFRRKISQNVEQLINNSGLSEEKIIELTNSLAKKGFIFNQPNSKGIQVFRLLPIINVGLFEYTFMKELEYNDENKILADLFTKFFNELDAFIQSGYDKIIPFLQKALPVDRTVPFYDNKPTGKEIKIILNKEVEVPTEAIIPAQKIEEIIAKFNDIAVGHCFCRHHKDLDGNPCDQTTMRENCFTFGKSAKHIIQQGFGRPVSKEEALSIMKESEKDGLVHKAYHPNFDISKPETSICNCCKCCCGNSYKNAIAPMINATNFISMVNEEKCVGCGLCIEKCINDAIIVDNNGKARRIEERCIGCGVCAHFCPENAIFLNEVKRIVNVPPPKKV